MVCIALARLTSDPSQTNKNCFELAESFDPEEQAIGDVAYIKFGLLVGVQLILLLVFLAVICFIPSSARESWLEDVCLHKTVVMNCTDWALTGLLFLVLLPVIFLTVTRSSTSFRASLWVLWTLVLTADLALFFGSFGWRTYAFAATACVAFYAAAVGLLTCVPREVLLLSWSTIYHWGGLTALVFGIVAVLISGDTNFALSAVVGAVVNLTLVYCSALILKKCPPRHITLGSMFLLFPEALFVCLYLIDKATRSISDDREGSLQQALADAGDIEQ